MSDEPSELIGGRGWARFLALVGIVLGIVVVYTFYGWMVSTDDADGTGAIPARGWITIWLWSAIFGTFASYAAWIEARDNGYRLERVLGGIGIVLSTVPLTPVAIPLIVLLQVRINRQERRDREEQAGSG